MSLETLALQPLSFYKNVYVLDNYDSFTYNLVQLLKEAGAQHICVERCDQVHPEHIEACDLIVLSPGPGLPQHSGQLLEVIQTYFYRKPILGICLGMQAIALVLGAKLYNIQTVYHGEAHPLHFSKQGLEVCAPLIHSGVNAPTSTRTNQDTEPFMVGRYHSWAVDPNTLPATLNCLASTADHSPMMIKHRDLPVWGLQFHPESILTPRGLELMTWIYEKNLEDEHKGLFFETIALKEGEAQHLNYHQKRMNYTLKHTFTPSLQRDDASPHTLDLASYLAPQLKFLRPQGLMRCRVSYSPSGFKSLALFPYAPQDVKVLQLVDSTLDYAFKYEDRTALNRLMDHKQDAQNILIVKDGELTDTAFHNIALYKDGLWYTPQKPLLPGTTRQRLLDEHRLIPCSISERDLPSFSKITLFNAMMPFQSLLFTFKYDKIKRQIVRSRLI